MLESVVENAYTHMYMSSLIILKLTIQLALSHSLIFLSSNSLTRFFSFIPLSDFQHFFY
jgi:hypothetical protein